MDYTDIPNNEQHKIRQAIQNKECFYGYLPNENCFAFIVKNYKHLYELECLEINWIQAYLNQSKFKNYSFETLKNIFDYCDIEILKKLYPITPQPCNSKRISLFRGCNSSSFIQGMSWTTNLDKAIWYAAQHKEYQHYSTNNPCSVYAATVDINEIYCRLDRFEDEYIVTPHNYWKIDIPQTEFRLDRER